MLQTLLSLLALSTPLAGQPNVYRSYQTGVYCNATGPIQKPNSLAELQIIVANAIANSKSLKAIGSRHSITDIICTEGIPIDMHGINYSILNPDGSATFGAGLELIDALTFLQQHDRTLIHVPSFGGITIGGAIGTGAHGSSLLHPTTLSDQIIDMTIIDGLGNLRKVTDTTELKALRVNLGLLGIIVDVTFETVPLFKMSVENSLHSDSILFDGTVVLLAKSLDWVQFWWFPNTDEVVLSRGSYVDVSTPGEAFTQMIPNTNPLILTGFSSTLELLQATSNHIGEAAIEQFTKFSLFTQVIGKPPIFSEDGVTLKNPATGFAWQLQSNNCKFCSWDNGDNSLFPVEASIVFDLSQFSPVLMMIKNVIFQYPANFPSIGIFGRFVKGSDALMSTASGRDSFALDFINIMRKDRYTQPMDGLGAFQAIYQSMVTNFGGRPHYGKNGAFYFTQTVIQHSVPNRDAFVAAMRDFDPNGIFLNQFGRRILGQSDSMDIDPQTKACALMDYCVCKKDSDCGVGLLGNLLMSCGQLNGFNVCKSLLNIPLPQLVFNDLKNLTDILNVLGIFQIL